MPLNQIISFLGSLVVVIVVAVAYFVWPNPKPPILKILLILFAVAAVLGILAGIIMPLIKNRNMTTKDNELKMVFNQIDDLFKIQSLTKEKVEEFFKIKLKRSDEPGDDGFDVYNEGSIDNYPFSLIQLYLPTTIDETKKSFLVLTISRKLNISKKDVERYFKESQSVADSPIFNFQEDNGRLRTVVINYSQ